MSSTTTATASTYNTTTRHTLSRRSSRGLGGIATASTPNLNQLYSLHSSNSSRLAPSSLLGLARKGSLAALTQNSLASIPDDSEDYAYNTVLTNDTDTMPPPLTPGKAGPADDIAVGDIVDVPGNMTGTVRFVGSVAGRKGTFAGVELHRDFSARGKNNGDVDGVFYFTTTQPGAGIFLPLSKAVKRGSPPTSASLFPLTPTDRLPSGGLKVGNQNSTNYTPPTPSLPKFSQSVFSQSTTLSQSVGPGRSMSPTGKRPAPRTSLPRPDSPVRKLQMTPAPRPSIVTPGPKPPTRFGSPTSSKFAQSVRGTAGDPNKRAPANARDNNFGARSASALGNTSTPSFTDEETTPVGVQRTQTNDSLGSISSFALKVRPASRAASRAGSRIGSYNNNNNDGEVERLKAQLEDRNRQLKDQSSTLAEMESSLTELQGLIESSEGPPGPRQRQGSMDDKDTSQLRALLREKNEKIAMLTAEFDAHRADFRSTIDTLEMASTETERVYEKRMEELMQEIQDLQDRTADVDTVATQLKQLEELVQELEEGLEDARRGEAEARGEVEFLRGEVERTRSELRREREKAQAALNGAQNGGPTSKEMEQKEDEIRGLKAIIHSLSRDAVPNDNPDRTSSQRPSSFRPQKGESIDERLAREKLEREVSELRAMVDSKTGREEELEREIEMLRRGSFPPGGPDNRISAMTINGSSNNNNNNNDRSSLRDSRGTVVLAPRSPEAPHKSLSLRHSRGHTLDTMPESDSYSTATENSTLWCEICETSGHDILTCTNMNFGPDQQQEHKDDGDKLDKDELRPVSLAVPGSLDNIKPAPLSPIKTKTPTSVPASVRILPNPMDSGPVAGKESGHVDASKWCALCERDGHDSVDCPFEDAF